MVSRYVITASIAVLFCAIVACSSSGEDQHLANAKASYEPVKAKMIYTSMCAICHGEDGKLGSAGALDLTQSTMDLATRKALIKYGRGQMTPFKARLTEEEIEWVAIYIESLRP